MSTPPLFVAGAAGVALLLIFLYRSRRETTRLREGLDAAGARLQQLQQSFSSFAPPRLVDQIIEAGMPVTGERREVAVLFADLIGFTALSEKTEPSDLVGILNGYFEAMSRAIIDHRGHVATFLGDGILALFGDFEPNPWKQNDSAHAALAMCDALERYNEELTARGLPRLALGIGLHTGTGIAGVVGSRDKKEFTVVGGPINIAARLEALTREHRVSILITEDFRAKLDPRFQVDDLGPAQLRGVEQPVRIYHLRGFTEAHEQRHARADQQEARRD